MFENAVSSMLIFGASIVLDKINIAYTAVFIGGFFIIALDIDHAFPDQKAGWDEDVQTVFSGMYYHEMLMRGVGSFGHTFNVTDADIERILNASPQIQTAMVQEFGGAFADVGFFENNYPKLAPCVEKIQEQLSNEMAERAAQHLRKKDVLNELVETVEQKELTKAIQELFTITQEAEDNDHETPAEEEREEEENELQQEAVAELEQTAETAVTNGVSEEETKQLLTKVIDKYQSKFRKAAEDKLASEWANAFNQLAESQPGFESCKEEDLAECVSALKGTAQEIGKNQSIQEYTRQRQGSVARLQQALNSLSEKSHLNGEQLRTCLTKSLKEVYPSFLTRIGRFFSFLKKKVAELFSHKVANRPQSNNTERV